ncbi:MAG: hypothetical protein Ct9H300mP19_13520 [Dehalococcoidia bacterium]|nr:MAG: hypothetical protein Ct9H300mP19_13520 [Dehalococcoidia bacterium]
MSSKCIDEKCKRCWVLITINDPFWFIPADEVTDGDFYVVVANIAANVLITLAETLSPLLQRMAS